MKDILEGLWHLVSGEWIETEKATGGKTNEKPTREVDRSDESDAGKRRSERIAINNFLRPSDVGIPGERRAKSDSEAKRPAARKPEPDEDKSGNDGESEAPAAGSE